MVVATDDVLSNPDSECSMLSTFRNCYRCKVISPDKLSHKGTSFSAVQWAITLHLSSTCHGSVCTLYPKACLDHAGSVASVVLFRL